MKKIGMTEAGAVLVEMPAAQFGALEAMQPLVADGMFEAAKMAMGGFEENPEPGKVATGNLQLSKPVPEKKRGEGTPPPVRVAKKKSAGKKLRKTPEGKLSIAPHLIAILEEAAGPLGVQALYEAYLARTGVKASAEVRRKIGISVATDKKRYERVGKGVYRLKRATLKAAEPERGSSLMVADVVGLTDGELEERLKRAGRIGKRDDAARKELMRRANDRALGED